MFSVYIYSYFVIFIFKYFMALHLLTHLQLL